MSILTEQYTLTVLTAAFWIFILWVHSNWCIFRHRQRRYVGAFLQLACAHQHAPVYCSLYHVTQRQVTIARWVCDRCNKMGETTIKRGRWTILHGKLAPDEKAWANPD